MDTIRYPSKPRTYTAKGYYGWRSATDVLLSATLHLSIVTMKRANGYLTTVASAGKLENGFVTHKVYEDLNVTFINTNPARITEKVVTLQHDSIDLDAIILQAQTFYNIPVQSCL